MSQRSASPSSDRNFAHRKKKIIKSRLEDSQKISQSGQSKITHFFKNMEKKQSKSPKRLKKVQMQLQLQIQQLKEQEQSLLSQRQQLLDHQKTTKGQFQLWMKKSRFLIQQCVSQMGANARLRKAQINYDMGFFDSGCRNFIPGHYGSQCQNKRDKLNNMINNGQLIDKFEEDMVKQMLEQQNNRLNIYKKQLDIYKQKLKIAHQQKTCKLSDTWPLLINRYQVIQLVGKGGFSEVYKAYDLEQNRYVAIKMSSTSGLKPQLAHYIVRQYQNHRKLDHPNIAKLYQVFEVAQCVCIALQYCEGPQLSSYIKQNRIISQSKARSIMKQILSALNYLSGLNPKIIHYDLKPQNIMFSNGRIKILDFGLSRQIDSQHSRIALSNQGIGTYWYLPPQTFDEKSPQVSEKVDIWSAGVILYEMIFGKRPFGHNKSQTRIMSEGIILDANNVDFPDDIEASQNLKSLIRQCLVYDYRNRYTPFEALSHPFFK